MKTVFVIIVGLLVFAAALYLVFSYTYQPVVNDELQKKELLVYCGITIIKPISEIARIIEKQEDCRIIITKGGSGSLLRAIEINKVGDLYLPSSDSYIKTCIDKGLVAETAFVGYDKAVLMVQKGNPKGISDDLDNLTNPRYYVAICDPNGGGIGRETKNILEKKGIFDAVCRNVREWTIDSKDLAKVLKDKEADLVVNWYAVSTWPENAPYMDAMSIDEKYAAKRKLVLGLLVCSRYPEIARKLMVYASSKEGIELFKKYGLYDVK